MTSTRRSGSMRPRSTSSSVLGSSSTVRPGRSLVPIAIVLLVSLAWGAAAGAAEYKGPLIDAHSHLPNARAIDAYVEAMKRHNVVKVVLLGVGGVQKDDPAWIAAAARKYPDRVVAALPLPDPTDDGAAARLDAALTKSPARAIGEVHLRQMGRRNIDRDPGDPAFGRILEVAAARGVPVVVHYELTDAAAAALDRAWKALLEKMPDRFLMGIDVWAPRLFEPAMLDRLFTWTRRILGELAPGVAERVAHRNAAALFHAE